uniref:Uncharacterized protein n=1 Tax=Arundo donax TaxID=35708 RepID=A0A0A9CJB2_ARUDO
MLFTSSSIKIVNSIQYEGNQLCAV